MPARSSQLMQELKDSQGFALSQGALERLREGFASARSDRATTLATIRRVAAQGMILDPHTAIGVAAAEACRGDRAIADGRCSARRTPPSSPTPSRKPAASARRCRRAWPTSLTGPSA